MLELLKYSEGMEASLNICRKNIFTIVAPESRNAFAKLLKLSSGSAKIDMLCFDGSRACFFVWTDKTEKGTIRAVFADINKWDEKNKAYEAEKYITALSAVYSDIFEFDYTAGTLISVYSERSTMLRMIHGIPMKIEEATERWILHKVPAEDAEKLRGFWSSDPSLKKTDRQIRYNVKSSDGTLWQYLGVFVPCGDNKWLFCCRKEPTAFAEKNSPYYGPKVRIRTFGYFDVFVGDTPIAFRNEKSKELLALLVDRKGGYVTSEEAIGFLWEDSPADSLTLSRYRKVALRLKNTLEEYGISGIIESVNGKRRIVPDRVQCDLYDYLSGKEEYSALFKGSYLTNYSWAENTLAELL